MKGRFKSIQWKIILIYSLLILVAMEIIWVYLYKSLENYHMNNFDNYLEAQVRGISFTLKDNMDAKSLKNIINMYMGPNSNVKYVYILDNEGNILASSTGDKGKMVTPAIVKALSGQIGSEVTDDYNSSGKIKSFAMPVYNSDGKINGVVYISGSLSGIYQTLADVNLILLSATLFAVAITMVLGYILSKTITDPIKEVTKYAQKMADGDFDVRIRIKSNDEIGKLGEMFNFLSLRLKQTLNGIQGEKNKIEAIIRFMTDGVVATDAKGRIIHFNEAAEKMLNANLELGMPIEGILNLKKEDVVATMNCGNKVLTVNIAPLKGNQQIEGYVYVLHDITEQHKLDTMRKEFVANVSHELRTPIATIKSYVETLLYSDVDAEYSKKFLKIIDSETDRMTRLVKDLLLLSKMDSEDNNLKFEQKNLNDIVVEAINRLSIEAQKKNQKLIVDLQETPRYVYIDRDKMEQVIVNLVTNAIKYTPENGMIKIMTEYDESFASLIVEDNGIGIPKEDLPRIFERFYRVDKARSRELGGTGLGLSIVKQIVELHKGEVNIESEVGKGTIVRVKLPYQ
ncbi:multi-sensor signal transduction histidine kinase [Thermoanaerobacter mathranii subsp. mathranii str. A3]|jgi:two-component system sensor histidine kinase VicK|uniref:histidine kinase n=1 Tax=Thermoanaerobacter mathranii subsp. mathranii (strain DSM 11426 / CCUG 53645 / CIP 108742 / A3) TaxID=583358 RepID=A0ABN3Z4K4_THEM3|nr:ATP-binding protein [Thermoanaerobacter thermocopriae]ADH61887.1 multi-sensor signal transduction histidine kinase [Thermoanaerobacter mathranii subsp. mathranii str. A3]